MQYIANGVSVFVLKYFVKNRTEKYAAIPEAKNPAQIGKKSVVAFAVKSSGSFSADAAKIMGVASKKEKRAASS